MGGRDRSEAETGASKWGERSVRGGDRSLDGRRQRSGGVSRGGFREVMWGARIVSRGGCSDSESGSESETRERMV